MPEIISPRTSLSTGTIVRFFLVLVLLIGVYYLFDLVIALLAAIVLASAIQPLIRKLNRMKIPRLVSVILIYGLLVILIGMILVFFVPRAVEDTIGFLGSLPQTISFGELWSPISNLGIGAPAEFSKQVIYIPDFVHSVRLFIGETSTGALQTATRVFGGLFTFTLIAVLSFYLAVQEDGVDSFLRIITPIKHHEYVSGLWHRSQRRIGLWLQGQVILGLVMGVVVYVVLVIFGIPHPLALALLAAILEIIPIFGAILAAIPAISLAFTTAGITKGILLVFIYFIIYQLESQFFYPMVVKKIVGISPLIVIISLIVGAKLAGPLGALVAVPLSAALMEYVGDIEKYKNISRAEKVQRNN